MSGWVLIVVMATMRGGVSVVAPFADQPACEAAAADIAADQADRLYMARCYPHSSADARR